MGINPNNNYFCSGFIEFGNRKFHCWKRGWPWECEFKGAIKNHVIVIFII